MKPAVSRIRKRVNAAALTLVAGLFAGACSHTPSSPTAPVAAVPGAGSVRGTVTDSATSAPIPGAAVVFSNPVMYVTTDSAGRYGFTDLPPYTNSPVRLVWVSASNYERDFRYYGSATQDFHLHRIDQITAGNSTAVTVAPSDSLCVNNVQDLPPWPICRSVHVLAPADGVMILDVVSAQDGTRPPLEVETLDVPGSCCSERLENPTSIHVSGGTVVVASIEIPSTSTASQTFTLNTSMVEP